ncbi:MAG: ArsC family reductase [Halioglobus sp.]
MITLYGIKNCDSVKKARKWLEARQIDYQFHDFREQGITRRQLAEWLNELGWETLINRRSTSWKALDEKNRQAMNDSTALDAALRQPTLIKRPLLDTGSERHVGFSPENYAAIFNVHTL